MLTSEQFDRTRRLALRLAGIELLDRHRELLYRRCRRIEILSAASLDALLSAAEDGNPAAGRQFVDLATDINEEALAVARLGEYGQSALGALNLVDPVWPIGGQFGVIFCRNVLMWSATDIACAATSSECANRLPQRISV